MDLKPVLQKLWSLCAPDISLLFLASVFMVRVAATGGGLLHSALRLMLEFDARRRWWRLCANLRFRTLRLNQSSRLRKALPSWAS